MSEPEAPLSDLLDRLAARDPVPHFGLEPGAPPSDLWRRLAARERELPTVRVLDKRRYCRDCEHFAAPPRMACTREGTEIEALVGTDRFRVRNCPVERS